MEPRDRPSCQALGETHTYGNQTMLVVRMRDYAWLVPFEITRTRRTARKGTPAVQDIRSLRTSSVPASNPLTLLTKSAGLSS